MLQCLENPFRFDDIQVVNLFLCFSRFLLFILLFEPRDHLFAKKKKEKGIQEFRFFGHISSLATNNTISIRFFTQAALWICNQFSYEFPSISSSCMWRLSFFENLCLFFLYILRQQMQYVLSNVEFIGKNKIEKNILWLDSTNISTQFKPMQ